MDTNELKNTLNVLSKLIDDGEPVLLSPFAEKLASASENYPEDKTIGVMAGIVAKMTEGKKLTISRSEVKSLYNKLYTTNTKFSELFSHELGQVEKLATVKTYDRNQYTEDLSIVKEAFEKVVDPSLANALDNAFGNPVRGYTAKLAETAKSAAARECACVRANAKIEVVSGDETVIITRASWETPKGQTSIFIPVEISYGKVVPPCVFVANAGVQDISRENIEEYIVANTGKKLVISEQLVLKTVKTAQRGSEEDLISDVDLALTKLNAEKEGKAELFANDILYQTVEVEPKNLTVQTPKYNDNGLESFAKSFDTPIGIANFQFGKEKVNLGRSVVSNKLNQLGIKNHQVSVFACDDDSITYAVAVNDGRLAFRVPLSIQSGKVIDPTIMIAAGSIESFSQEGMRALNTREARDYKTAAVASPLYGLKASELVEIVRVAVGENHYAKAEDALNVLSEAGDSKAYNTAFAAYTSGLGNKKAAEVQKCKMIVKNSSSKHDICGHTGLPLHKIYVDKNGDCHPAYRQGMDDTYEGAYLQNHKILF
jgi:hypothetical protein